MLQRTRAVAFTMTTAAGLFRSRTRAHHSGVVMSVMSSTVVACANNGRLLRVLRVGRSSVTPFDNVGTKARAVSGSVRHDVEPHLVVALRFPRVVVESRAVSKHITAAFSRGHEAVAARLLPPGDDAGS